MRSWKDCSLCCRNSSLLSLLQWVAKAFPTLSPHTTALCMGSMILGTPVPPFSHGLTNGCHGCSDAGESPGRATVGLGTPRTRTSPKYSGLPSMWRTFTCPARRIAATHLMEVHIPLRTDNDTHLDFAGFDMQRRISVVDGFTPSWILLPDHAASSYKRRRAMEVAGGGEAPPTDTWFGRMEPPNPAGMTAVAQGALPCWPRLPGTP